MLRKAKTTLVNVPKGTTSRIQPLDVSINMPFEAHIRKQFEDHIDKNLHLYTDNKISAGEPMVLLTKWVGNAWQSIKGNPELIKRSFMKCGISIALDGSENHCVNIKGLDSYMVPEVEEEYEILTDDESDDEDVDCCYELNEGQSEISDSDSDDSATSGSETDDTDTDVTE